MTTTPITLDVDAREAPRKLFHSHLSIPVTPGPLSLVYPKWIPGEHGPTGPVVDLAGLALTIGGRTLPWRRDDVDPWKLHLEIPAGADRLEVAFDLLSATAASGFSAGASASPRIAVVSWNQLVLVPDGIPAAELALEPSLTVPRGWSAATALDETGRDGDRIRWAATSLETLVDSPVLMGVHVRRLELGERMGAPHSATLAAECVEALAASDAWVESLRALPIEAEAIFGARHYRRYEFLVSLSDAVAHFGLEHHESSDNRTWERSLVDDDRRLLSVGLLPHEYVHSWNGKHRRPTGLATPDYQQPMKAELLWIYEGLTEYLGDVLTARTGFWNPEQYRQHIAFVAAFMESRHGRRWRPLLDTAVAAQLLYGAPGAWSSRRRSIDVYDEGELLWLEVDALLRTGSGKSIDDFCHRFHGGESGPPSVRPYDLDEVVSILADLDGSRDWSAFFAERVDRPTEHAPTGGIELGGWRLAWGPKPSPYVSAREKVRNVLDLRFSLGFILETEQARILDVVPETPADAAGLAPGETLVAVDGRKQSTERLREAIARAQRNDGKIELLIEDAELFRTVFLDWKGGERYPILERNEAVPDVLSQILAPRRG